MAWVAREKKVCTAHEERKGVWKHVRVWAAREQKMGMVTTMV